MSYSQTTVMTWDSDCCCLTVQRPQVTIKDVLCGRIKAYSCEPGKYCIVDEFGKNITIPCATTTLDGVPVNCGTLCDVFSECLVDSGEVVVTNPVEISNWPTIGSNCSDPIYTEICTDSLKVHFTQPIETYSNDSIKVSIINDSLKVHFTQPIETYSNDSIRVSILNDSLKVHFTQPIETYSNDSIKVSILNDSLKVHFTQPIETYSNDSIKVSILNDSLKVHFTQPIETYSNDSIKVSILNDSLKVHFTQPIETYSNDSIKVSILNDSLKVHFTQPIETYSNDSIKVSILNDSLKVHFTQPIEVINDKIDSLSLVSCISGNALLVQECEKDTVLQSVLTICESCDGNGFDVTSVLGQCSKINFDDNTNAFNSICGAWTAQDLSDLLNKGNPIGATFSVIGNVLYCDDPNTCPSTIEFVSLPISIAGGAGCTQSNTLGVTECNSANILAAINQLVDNSCPKTPVATIICATTTGIYNLVNGGTVNINAGDELVLSQLFDCNGNPQSYALSALVSGELQEIADAIEAGDCPTPPTPPVSLGCIKDEKGNEWEVWEATINGTTTTYYLDPVSGVAGTPAGLPANWTECGSKTVQVPKCDGTTYPVSVDNVTATYQLNDLSKEVIRVYDNITATLSGSVQLSVAGTNVTVDVLGVTSTNWASNNYLVDFGAGFTDYSGSPSFNYVNEPDGRYEIKVFRVFVYPDGVRYYFVQQFEINKVGGTVTVTSANPAAVNRSITYTSKEILQVFCNGQPVGTPIKEDGSVASITGALSLSYYPALISEWTVVSDAYNGGSSSTVTTITPTYSSNRTLQIANTVPAAYNVVIPANTREITIQNITGADVQISTTQGNQIVGTRNSILLSNPNNLDQSQTVFSGNITVSFLSNVLGNISGVQPRVIINFKSY